MVLAKFRNFTLLFIIALVFCTCKKYAPANPVFYLKATDVFVKGSQTVGSGNNKITELYVYVDGFFQGAYPIGNLMPIAIKDGETKINLFAGIKNNGISETRVTYAFYEALELDTVLSKGQILDKTFTFEYKPAAKIWFENFDGNSLGLIKSSSSDTTIFKSGVSNPNNLEGQCGIITLQGNKIFGRVETSLDFDIPKGSSNTYIEINFKGNAPIEVGLLTELNQEKVVGNANSKDTWNKVYFQISEAVSAPPTSLNYKLYLKVKNTSDNPNPTVYIDNFKLLYF